MVEFVGKYDERHPFTALTFREGDVRMARILSILTLQAGLPLLNFSLIAEEKKQEYFAAVQAGLDKNYEPMERLFAEIIERSLASS
jgi:cell filamentation protein